MANWVYKQSTGELFKDGKLIETGYSGALTNKNNPDRDMRTFRMHGDKRIGIAGFASEGCIIMSHPTRLLVSKDTGALLEVVR